MMKSLPTMTVPSVAAVAAAVLLSAPPALASMLPPCDLDTTLEMIDFTSPDGEACTLCVQTAPEECSFNCAAGGACGASPPGCGEIACPEPFVPPPRAEGCPDVAPEMFAPCDFEAAGDCFYPEAHGDYCGFTCMEGEAVMFCYSGGQGQGGGGWTTTTPPPPTDCAAFSSCAECLSHEGCDAWSVGSCYATCLDGPMDTSCWSTASLASISRTFTDEGPEEICQMAEDEAADDALCSSQPDCGSCLGTETSDGGNNCQWFEDGYCDNGCGMVGCGVLACPTDGGGAPPGEEDATPPPADCAAFSSCSECLSQEGCDAWSVGSCYATCLDGPMDTSCWSTASPLSISRSFTDEGPEEICQMAEDEAADDALCSSQPDCGSCLGAETSDGGNNCQWFEDGYCDNGCGMVGCGVLACPTDGGGAPPSEEDGMGGVIVAYPDEELDEEASNGVTADESPDKEASNGVTVDESPDKEASSEDTSSSSLDEGVSNGDTANDSSKVGSGTLSNSTGAGDSDPSEEEPLSDDENLAEGRPRNASIKSNLSVAALLLAFAFMVAFMM